MKKTITIALDAMGGDYGQSVTLPAALRVLSELPDLKIILVGIETEINEALEALPAPKDPHRLMVRHASQVIEMDELPASALRGKKDSSMRVAIDLVKKGEADACVSAGNTGALMATARFVLKTLPGIDRPAIIKTLPSRHGLVRVLDLGANVECSSENLMQFALMGSVFAQEVDKIPSPRVALLNIGQEEIKGNDQVKQASRLLAASSLNYIGYLEGDGIFMDLADVIVCDGFVGNVSLKVIEGLAKMIASSLQSDFRKNILTKIAGLIAYPVMRKLKTRLDPGRYNGATLLGLRGTVIKSHGSADISSFAHAIRAAIREVEGSVPEQIEKQLEKHIGGALS